MTGTLPSRLMSPWVALLRWNKPSGRLILLIPAGWSLWLNPAGPPSLQLILQILIGGLSVSAAGCVANDLWDQRIDREVARTSQRPLARGDLNRVQAFTLLAVLLTLSLLVVISLPGDVRWLCLQLAVLALPPILFYPSAKRWFPFPQAILALCWGFAVLIPWAAATGSLSISLPLLATWGATLCWTFSFDTVYAMADRVDDAKLKLRSSALTLGDSAVRVVRAGYGLTAAGLAMAAAATQAGVIFWIVWAVACIGFWRSTLPLKAKKQQAPSVYANHFARQVQLGSLLLAGVILSRLG
ncbi:4-hydroxybenzoate polyprenyltransferase [Synechococcus sp. CS-197]|uniref:4-hydroxybenzoate polyprenyltransferase n=1 Tax=Synechococcus sp. CS-197 TaxID=2847985 RepID=UPI000152502E|nr:4-hydroxybenzoate polyprenyltransferase [Synechococcus sp. CS-197]MCT0251362.1 4-hydroxybenzoate polyprenyltransferase [Synechococcus sp. CS-197]CAK24282.1 4-hydroxybenzoate octaprenyltransferase [Synechococcus sp. WH 7803]